MGTSISSLAQTAMEVEGVGEDEEHRGRRLSDYYDIHQEIGRCGARKNWLQGPEGDAGSEGGEGRRVSAVVTALVIFRVFQRCLLLPAAGSGAELWPGVCSQVHP